MSRYPQNWDLSLLPAPETAEFREELRRLGEDLRSLAEQLAALPPWTDHASIWSDLLMRYERIEAKLQELQSCVACWAAADANNVRYQQLEAELANLTPWRERILTHIDHGLRAIPEASWSVVVQATPWLHQIEPFLAERRRLSRLRLSPALEALAVDLNVDGLHAWGRLYDRLSGALRVEVWEKGKLVRKSPGQVTLDSPQRAVREANFYAADAAWQSIEAPCAEALNHIAGTRLSLYRHLQIDDHLLPPCWYSRIDRKTLDVMWQTIADRRGFLLDYLRAKAAWLGLERLSWFDLSAPLPLPAQLVQEQEIPYEQACDHIVAAFHAFSPEMGEFARMAMQQRWVEAENRSGKRQGAFCTGFPVSQQSRVFMTYVGTADSMSTLAHELGHAYHAWVLREEPVFLSDYPMTLAETASTFAETILAEVRLQETGNSWQRLALLDGLLADAVTFLMNIHARFLFEDRFHCERREGEVPASRLSELMLQAQQEAYHQALADDGWNPRFWVSKLHFYITSLPFYNFPYTFGYLLSQGLYEWGRQQGPAFAQRYRQLLLATGRMAAEEAVMSTLGFDLRQPDFWVTSLEALARRTRQFCELTELLLREAARL
ncbi:MAG: oligoendopeptidase [Planctomycetaceae bacterium]|nr:MAG: oligoendopeptidase [Planctomycetaceae bacterium]